MKNFSVILLSGLFYTLSLIAQETDGFETEVNAGFTLTSGNSDTTTLVLGAEAKDIKEKQETILTASYEYGQTTNTNQDGIETETTNMDRSKLVGQSNWLLSEMVYVFYNLTAERDQIAKVDYRINTGPGFGYYFRRDEVSTFSTESSLVYVMEDQDGTSDDYTAFRLAEKFEYKFGENARIWQSFEGVFELSDVESYFLNAEIGAEAKLTAKLALRIVLKDKYDNQPQSGVENNDLTLISGISIAL